jgi:cutinase
LIPDVTGYAVQYPATFAESSPGKGVEDILSHLGNSTIACPEQKYALAGYSQGAIVLHRVAVEIPDATLEKIIAAVTFGDGGWSHI